MALLIGGAWAIFGFRVLRRRERADAELKKLTLEMRDLELSEHKHGADISKLDAETRKLTLEEVKLRGQAAVHVAIAASCRRAHDQSGFYIFANVTLTNSGTHDTRIKWQGEPAPFSVRPVRFPPNEPPRFDAAALELRVRQTRNPNEDAVSHVVRASASERLAFVAHIASPGVYLLAFRGAVDESERKASSEAGAILPTSWTAQEYLIVDETQAPTIGASA